MKVALVGTILACASIAILPAGAQNATDATNEIVFPETVSNETVSESTSTEATAAAAATTVAVSANVTDGNPVPTDGNCLIETRLQDDGEALVGVPTNWHPDGNIVVKLAGEDCAVGVSETWGIAGWHLTIVQMAPNQVFSPPALADDERQLVKVMRGSLVDVNLIGIFKDGRWETYTVTPPNRAAPLYVDNSVTDIAAGDEGAVIVYWKVSEETLNTPATDMTASPVADISGPYADNLQWVKFGTYFPDPFADVEFYNLAGILLQENDGSRLAYMQFWTFREDQHADGYHNHDDLDSENAFGEIHMAMYAANAVSGMQTTLPGTENKNYQPNPADTSGFGNSYSRNNQTEVQIAIPMPPGFAHGPLWSVDPSTGEPTRICLGAIQYPFHRWLIQSNGELNSPLRYSMWVAYEHLPEDVTIPSEMLTEWPNANLQSTMTAAECNGTVTSDGSATSNTTEIDGGIETDVRTESNAGSESDAGDEPDSSGSLVHLSAFAWILAFVILL